MAPTHNEMEDTHNKPPSSLADRESTAEHISAHHEAMRQEQIDAIMFLLELSKDHVEQVLRDNHEFSTSQTRAIIEEFESLLGLLHYTAYLHDMNDTNNLASADGTTTHSVDYTKALPIANGNITHNMVAECRSRAVVAYHRQADCTYGASHGSFVRELAKCDALANVSIFENSCFTGTLVVLAFIAGMLCSVFDLLSECQARVLALGVTAVYLVVRFGGM